MELKAYAGVIRRYLWLVVGLPLAVLLLTLLLSVMGEQSPQLYRATTTLLVDVPPLPAEPDMGFDPRESAAAAAAYLVDDFSEFVTSEAFAGLVTARLATQGINVPPGAISGSESSETRHRVLILAVTWPNAAEARAIIGAAGEVAQSGLDQYFARSGVVSVLSGPAVAPIAAPLAEQIQMPLRVLLALLVGLGLAFLLDYLDDSVRTAEEAEVLLRAPVVGEIPAEGRGGIRAGRRKT
jgi:capsular polysaccharide biosynthesis protein